MTEHQNWMANTLHFFDKHPEREFWLTKIPLHALLDMSAAGWLACVASAPTSAGQTDSPSIIRGQSSIPCIVRRADRAEGRPLPGVFLMDGAPQPPQSTSARVEELFCERMWGLAQVAEAEGVSFLSLMANRASLARAAVAIGVPSGS